MADFAKFIVAVTIMAIGLYYMSLFWYRTLGNARISLAMRLSPVGLIGFPAACLALFLFSDPRWPNIVVGPGCALLLTGAAYLGLRRAANERSRNA